VRQPGARPRPLPSRPVCAAGGPTDCKSDRRELNPQLPRWRRGALPFELQSHGAMAGRAPHPTLCAGTRLSGGPDHRKQGRVAAEAGSVLQLGRPTLADATAPRCLHCGSPNRTDAEGATL
jgi:hypothetical protein